MNGGLSLAEKYIYLPEYFSALGQSHALPPQSVISIAAVERALRGHHQDLFRLHQRVSLEFATITGLDGSDAGLKSMWLRDYE